MELKVNKEKCLICGMCASMNPDVFNFDDEGFIKVNNNNISEDNKNEIQEIKNNCPVSAIEDIDVNENEKETE